MCCGAASCHCTPAERRHGTTHVSRTGSHVLATTPLAQRVLMLRDNSDCWSCVPQRDVSRLAQPSVGSMLCQAHTCHVLDRPCVCMGLQRSHTPPSWREGDCQVQASSCTTIRDALEYACQRMLGALACQVPRLYLLRWTVRQGESGRHFENSHVAITLWPSRNNVLSVCARDCVVHCVFTAVGRCRHCPFGHQQAAAGVQPSAAGHGRTGTCAAARCVMS